MEKTLAEVVRLAWYRMRPVCLDDWQSVADAVVAAHEARRWKAIESAPKDGTPIMAWARDWANPYTAYWTNERTTLNSEGGWVDGSTNRYDEYYASSPTHWTPIPAPPKESSDAE